jgi:O-acetyl-ADP-ribose deacetylase (regulator of RNase III)
MQYITGNFIETDLEDLAHGCNAQGVMGSGAAKDVRARWPGAYNLYRDFYESNEVMLGHCITYNTGAVTGPRRIHNLVTQDTYGNDGKFARYIHLSSSIAEMLRGPCSGKIAIPRIGSGRGGLKWEFVSEILHEFEEQTGIEFHVYSPEA